MPYIHPDDRPRYDSLIEDLISKLRRGGNRDGHLNYAICRLAFLHWRNKNSTSYDSRKEIQGVLHGALREWDKCMVDPYETEKEVINGPVFE